MRGAQGLVTLALLVLPNCILCGCTVGPSYREPKVEMPERWHESATDGLAAGEANVQTWWQVLDDETLSGLIQRAAENNLEVRLAVLRIRNARALRNIAIGQLSPTLSGQDSYKRSKASANGPAAVGARPPGRAVQFAESVARGIGSSTLGNVLRSADPNAPGITLSFSLANSLIGLIPTPTRLAKTAEQNLFTNGFDASWEIDIFGGIRRNIESADAALAATVEDYRDVLVSLLAEVAATYIDIRALQAEVEATRQNVELQRQTLSLTQSLFASGLVSELDVRQAQTNLATTQSQLPLLETGVALTIYRMGVLTGRQPSALWDELSRKQPIPTPPSQTLVGVPIDILRRRPDIRAAERRLAAQTAQIGVAVADLYPRFTLSGTFAFQATDVDHALDARSITYGFGPAVSWNLFDGLQNLNRIAAQEAAAHQAYVTYEQTILLALQDVESSMVAYRQEQVRRDVLLRAVEAAERSTKLAENRYRDGLTDFQSVLDAQRSLVTLENALAQSRGQVVLNLVALYKALGGGWSPDVTPQSEYLDYPSGATADPVGFFFSAGKNDLPWNKWAEENTEDRSLPAEGE